MIPIIAIYNIPKSIEVAYNIYDYILRTYKDQSGIKYVKVLIDNIKAAQNTAIAFIFLHESRRTEEQLASLVELFNNREYSFNDETRIIQARVEWNQTKEYHSKNTRDSHNVDIVVVTYQALNQQIRYHTDHRSITNDLIKMESNDDPHLADNLAIPDQIDDDSNNVSTTIHDAKPDSPQKHLKLSPSLIETILRSPRRHSNLEAMAIPFFFSFFPFFPFTIINFLGQGRHVDSVTLKSRCNINLFTLNKLNFQFPPSPPLSLSRFSRRTLSMYKVNTAKDDWIINPII
jgi:hypothetical protein